MRPCTYIFRFQILKPATSFSLENPRPQFFFQPYLTQFLSKSLPTKPKLHFFQSLSFEPIEEWFEEILVYCISHCSPGVYLTAVIMTHSSLSSCVPEDQCKMLPKFHQITQKTFYLYVWFNYKKCLPEWDRATPLMQKSEFSMHDR